MKLRMKKSKKWWKDEEGTKELKKLFNDGLTIRGIAKICELKPTFVYNQLIRIGCDTSGKARNHIYSRQKKGANFFDEIDNEEKAYWLGFIWADGNIRQDYHALRINLAEIDSSHLEKLIHIFKTEVKFNSSIKNQKVLKGAYIAVNNVHLCKTLAEKGIVPNKTEHDSADIFDYIPQNLLKHFVRGFFDGDGTNNSSVVAFVGGEKFLSKLQDIIIKESNVHTDGSLYDDGSVYRLRWNGINVTNIIRNWIGKNATIYLERKWADFYNRWNKG